MLIDGVDLVASGLDDSEDFSFATYEPTRQELIDSVKAVHYYVVNAG